MPAAAIVLGDFNMRPDSAEYRLLCDATDASGASLLTDLWAHYHPGQYVMSWHSNPSKAGPAESALLDYCLISRELGEKARDCWIDETATGSDHQPLWAVFEPD